MRIQRIDLYRVTLPLIRPYRLSYGPISALHSLWARAELEGNRIGWGESTPLPGYAESTIEVVVKSGKKMALQWIGRQVSEILATFPRDLDGFMFTAVFTALEEACGAIPQVQGWVPLAALVQEHSGERPSDALKRARAKGYRFFKVKVGFHNIVEEKTRIQQFQESLFPGEKLRIDANQSLAFKDAFALAEICSPETVELLEQPYPISCWEKTAELRKHSPVAIMLDEAITDMASIERAAKENAADLIKLKWMKQGSLSALQGMVEGARRMGVKIVFGNGVASCLNNRQEAIFWLLYLRDFQMAGEMNGFLKIRDDICSDLIRFEDGCAFVPAFDPMAIDGIVPKLDAATVLSLKV